MNAGYWIGWAAGLLAAGVLVLVFSLNGFLTGFVLGFVLTFFGGLIGGLIWEARE